MMKKFNHILVFGDNHGQWDVFPNFIRDKELNNCAVIVAGDFGIGFEPMKDEIKRLKYLSKRMNHSKSVLFAVRGNHDNTEYFTGKFDTDNVKLVPDYTVLNINDINILCVGGAFSVDRTDRKSYYFPREKNKNYDIIVKNDYWKDEVFVYDHDKVMSMKNIDVVVTHSAPQICPPYTKGNLTYWVAQDKNILQDCRIERSQFFQLYDNLTHNGNVIKKWYYGHFHMSNRTPYLDTLFVGLDIDEVDEIKI
jgi:predicted phosphodiesterase